jgi:hypothetical protein
VRMNSDTRRDIAVFILGVYAMALLTFVIVGGSHPEHVALAVGAVITIAGAAASWFTRGRVERPRDD